MSIMLRLKEETATLHQNAENMELERALAKGSLPKDVYVAMLEQRLLVHRVLEAKLKAHLNTSDPIAAVFEDHQIHSGRIEEDLRFFERDPQSITPLASTTETTAWIESLSAKQPEALLGIHYVFEGSTNGARFLARGIAKAYQLTDTRGIAYFNSTGEKQPENWRNFKTSMDSITFTPEQQDAIVEAAKATFNAIASVDRELYPAPVEA